MSPDINSLIMAHKQGFKNTTESCIIDTISFDQQLIITKVFGIVIPRPNKRCLIDLTLLRLFLFINNILESFGEPLMYLLPEHP